MNVSFSGNVFLAGNTGKFAKPNEISKLQKYADKNCCDILVLDRDYRTRETGRYKTIIVTTDERTCKNKAETKIFDFKEGFRV